MALNLSLEAWEAGVSRLPIWRITFYKWDSFTVLREKNCSPEDFSNNATLNGTPIRVSSATDLTGGIVGVGYSPRVKPDDFLQVFSKLLQRGGMFYREGSGALTLCYVASGSLIGYVEQHINSWDCLGALAIIEAAGGKTNDFLANDGLWKGNRLIAGPEALSPTLESFFEC